MSENHPVHQRRQEGCGDRTARRANGWTAIGRDRRSGRGRPPHALPSPRSLADRSPQPPMRRPGDRGGGRAGHLPRRVARRRPIPRPGRGCGVDLGYRGPAPHRSAPQSQSGRDGRSGWRNRALSGGACPPRDRAGDLAGAIDRLAPELRAVLQATILDGLTMREASVLLHIPTGTVKTRLRRARLELREALT